MYFKTSSWKSLIKRQDDKVKGKITATKKSNIPIKLCHGNNDDN